MTWAKKSGMSHFSPKRGICYFLGQSARFVQRIFRVLALKKGAVSDKLY